MIAHYRLERDATAGAFQLYRRDGVALVISGMGKVAAASATAYLHLKAGAGRHAQWLNVGIAGHGSREVGEAVLAHTVHDRASGQSWYPPHVFVPGLPSEQVTTVDVVERDFPDDAAYEMEASGFYPTACRFSSSELVQCVKVVSDNPGAAPERLSAKRVESLIEAQLGPVVELAEQVGGLSLELRKLEKDPPELEAMLRRWHFTVTEGRQLRRLLERWRTLNPKATLPEEELSRLRRGKDIVRTLRAMLEGAPTELSG